MKRFLMIAGGLLSLDTLMVMAISAGRNLGVFLPAIMGVPLLAAGLFYERLGGWSAQMPCGALLRSVLIYGYCAALAYFVIMGAVLVCFGNAAQPVRADALIVLGCRINGERPSLTLKKRLDAAADYLNAYPDAVAIVSGGQGTDEVMPESVVMKRYLIDAGIDASRVYEEAASQSTYENFVFSRQIIHDVCGNDASIAFITTRFHVLRSSRIAQKLGVEAHAVGAPGVWYITLNEYMRECAAIGQYWLLGRI